MLMSDRKAFGLMMSKSADPADPTGANQASDYTPADPDPGYTDTVVTYTDKSGVHSYILRTKNPDNGGSTGAGSVDPTATGNAGTMQMTGPAGSGATFTLGVTGTSSGNGGTVFTPAPPWMPGVDCPTNVTSFPAGSMCDWTTIFNWSYYVNLYPDLAAAIGNDPAHLFQHFRDNGIGEGRQAAPNWSVDAYIARYADLAAWLNPPGMDLSLLPANRMMAVAHWFKHGMAEGRVGTPVPPGDGTGQGLPPSPPPPIIMQGPPPMLTPPNSTYTPATVLTDKGGDITQLTGGGGEQPITVAVAQPKSMMVPLIGVGAALYLLSRLGKGA